MSTSHKNATSGQFIASKTFRGVGYSRDKAGLPLETISVPVPQPGPNQVLIHAFWSSLNPLEFKLANLNFMGRVPPVILGFDVAGVVTAVGEGVTNVQVGDAVMAMADPNGDGGWAEGGTGGYTLARDVLTVKKPANLSFCEAAALPMCFLSAYVALKPLLREGSSIYIPGGGGGVGHLAVQMASRAMKAGVVISSGSTQASRDLARASGAHHVFDYRNDDVGAQIMRLTGGAGVDIVYDTTYSESSFENTAQMVRRGGSWVVLGVGPGKTSRTAETSTPVPGILTSRGADYVNVNVLSYFSEPAGMDVPTRQLLAQAMQSMASWAVSGEVRAHVDRAIEGSAEAISENLRLMQRGSGNLGKIAVRLLASVASDSSTAI